MATVSGNSAAGELLRHYDDREAAAKEAHRLRKPVVGVTSNTVPRELIVAAGMFPVLLSPTPEPSALAGGQLPHELYMENVLDTRSRTIFDYLVSGTGGYLRSVMIPRTSEAEHKLFLYLREVNRQGQSLLTADVHLYNLLHTRSTTSRRYSRERTASLKGHLETISGQEVTRERLREAIDQENDARKAARMLAKLREAGRLGGAEGFAMLGARHFMEAREFARLVDQAVHEIDGRAPPQRPRLLIKGYLLDHTALHAEIESRGAVVIAEDDWHGSRGVTENIRTEGDPFEAVFEHYYEREVSPRVFPLGAADAWFHERAHSVDGVVFYLPPDDDVIGWDYLRHCRYLDQLRVPHTMVRADAAMFGGGPGESTSQVERARANLSDFVAHLPEGR